MKYLGITAALLTLSATVFAADTCFQSKDYTCAELQQLTEQNGSICVHGWIGDQTYYSKTTPCPENEYPQAGYYSSKDHFFCMIGDVCETENNGGGGGGG